MLNYSAPSLAPKYTKASVYTVLEVFDKSMRDVSSGSFLEFIFTETA